SCLAAPPDNICPNNGNCPNGVCPGEFASYISGSPFYGQYAGGPGILTLNNDPVPLMPNAQADLQNGYSTAQNEQQCSSGVKAANAELESQLSQSFLQCCQSVSSQLSGCKSSCPMWPFSLFFGCTTNCVSQ